MAANTDYGLQLQLGGGVEACSCEAREWVTVSTFTSGSAADQQAPTFEGITALEYGERIDASNDCGETKGLAAFPTLTEAADATSAPRYNIYIDGELEKRFVQNLGSKTQASEIFVDCGSSALSTQTLVQPGQQIEVRAVDLAGNESAPNQPITIGARCDAPDAQGSAAPVPDSGSADAGIANDVPASQDGNAGASGSAANSAASSPSTSSCALSDRVGANFGATLWALVVLFWRRVPRPQ